jgi:subtilisin family serine protease
LINSVFNYAKDQGMVIVVASGNSGINLQYNGNTFSTYCDAPHVICVSAVGPSLATSTNLDEPSFFTNYGKNSVDIAAPGGNAAFTSQGAIIPSAWPWGTDIASWVWSFCAKQRLSIQKAADGINGNISLTACAAGNRLTGNVGTSQASPHVAGLAALLVAEGVTDPATIKQRIQKSADPIASSAYGRGRMNVKKALGL